MRPISTTPPTDEELVSMSGVPPVTVIVSETVASFKVIATSSVCPTFTTMPLFSTRVNPCSSAVRS